MPLLKGSSKKVVSQNISEFHTGKTYAKTLRKFGSKKANDQAVAVALSTARKYARKAEGGGRLETTGLMQEVDKSEQPQDPRMKAIGIRPVTETPPAPPISGPPAQPEGSWEYPKPEGSWGPPVASEDDLTKAYLKNISGTETGAAGTFLHKILSAPVQGMVDLVKAPGEMMKGPEQTEHRTPGFETEEEGALQNINNQAYDRQMTDFGAGMATNVLGISKFFKTPENAVGIGGAKLKTPEKAFGQFFHPYDFNPEELKGIKQTGPQKGSNPGGLYELPSGEPVYIKTPKTHEHTYNEKLATELYKLADVPVADVKMSKFKGKPSLVSPIIPGQELNKIGDFSQTKGLAEHYPVDLWLGNFDAMKGDNVIVTDHNQAYRIDMGGALRFRAQGEPKTPAMWGPDVQHFDPNKNPGAAAMKGQPNVDMMPAAKRVANITDQQIHDLVQKFGPVTKVGEPKLKLEETLKARRDQIAEMYGVNDAPPAAGTQYFDNNQIVSLPPKASEPLGVSTKDFQDDVKAFDPSEKWDHYDAIHGAIAGQQLGLTTGQREAISYWTNPAGYKDLNGYLRGANKSQTAAELVPELDSALAAHPLQQDTVVWRGLHGPHADQLIGLKEGDTFFNAGYTATTIDPRRATHYGKKSDPGIIVNYHMPAGSEGLYTSHPDAGGWSTAERELLLPHGQGFKITGIEKIKAPIWDYTGALVQAKPHDFTVYHVEPIWGSAGTQLDAVKGATPLPAKPAAPKQSPSSNLPQQATAKPLTDEAGITAEDKAEAILKFANGDEAKVKHNLGVQNLLYGAEYGKAVAEAVEKAKGPKKYTWNGMTLADPDKMANALMKTPGKIDDKIANLEKIYGKDYATAVAEAHDDAIIKQQVKEFKDNDYAYDDDNEPPVNLTSEDLGQGYKELKFQGKPWFGKNTKEQVTGEWDTHRIEQEMKKGDGVIQILNNKQWVDEYRPPTKKNHLPVFTPNAIADPAKGGFNKFVEFHHNTPDVGPSGYLEKILDLKNKYHAPGSAYSGEQALYGLDYPFKGYNYHQTGPYLMNPKKVAVAYWPNFFGHTLAETKNNGEGASGGMQKRIIAAAQNQGVDLVVLHGMNDTGGINQTQMLVINHKILRAKDAKFDPARFDASAIDPATGHEYSHTMWGIAGASAVGAGLAKGQKQDEDKKMARGGKVKEREPQDHEFINFAKGGMINSDIPGRTDKIPMKVATGAYVLPADIPSALGQGNTIAGKTILDKMFNSGPYGLPLAKGRPQKFQMPRVQHLKGFSQFADGGNTDHTPIIAAGGEYIVGPDEVMRQGNGSMTAGHRILDAFTLHVRKEHIKTLRGLKGPK